MTSPAGLAVRWIKIGGTHWLFMNAQTLLGSVYCTKAGYRTNIDAAYDDTTYDTLDEAKAVAIALIAMRGK